MNRVCIVLAVVLFLVALVVLVATDTPDPKLIQGLELGGLAAFAASFLPW